MCFGMSNLAVAHIYNRSPVAILAADTRWKPDWHQFVTPNSIAEQRVALIAEAFLSAAWHLSFCVVGEKCDYAQSPTMSENLFSTVNNRQQQDTEYGGPVAMGSGFLRCQIHHKDA
jgi:hypothetical protein